MMIRKVVNYIKDESFQFKYINNSLNIINFREIKTLTDDLISLIDNNNHLLIIRGNNLVLKRMVVNEVLIKGNIKSIEM